MTTRLNRLLLLFIHRLFSHDRRPYV